jgi:hypothetical protein
LREKYPDAPTPWRVGESVGGKMFIYDANSKVIIVPNMSSTNRTKEQLHTIYRLIVRAVNQYAERQANEEIAWKNFDKKG